MTAVFTAKFDYRDAIHLTQSSIEQLYKVCSEFVGASPKISVTFKGGRTIQSREIQSVLEDTYFKTVPIASVMVIHASENAIFLDFDTDKNASAYVTIEGEKKAVVACEAEILAVLNASRPPYHWLVHYPNKAVARSRAIAFFSLLVPAGILAAVLWPEMFYPERFKPVLIAFLGCAVFVNASWWVLPNLVFDIGVSARPWKWRLFIWSVLVIGVAVSVMGNFATKLLER